MRNVTDGPLPATERSEAGGKKYVFLKTDMMAGYKGASVMIPCIREAINALERCEKYDFPSPPSEPNSSVEFDLR